MEDLILIVAQFSAHVQQLMPNSHRGMYGAVFVLLNYYRSQQFQAAIQITVVQIHNADHSEVAFRKPRRTHSS